MIAGQIEIQMMADLVRLKRDMDEVKSLMASRASEVQALAANIRNAFGALGIGLSIGQLVDLGRELLAAKIRAESLKTALDFATGGRGAAEIVYLRGVTRDLGLEFQTTATSYAKFAAASRGTAIEGEGARKVFESVAKASAVMGLSAEQNEGVLLALGQMISKGTVQSEELRGQLGERLPGAFQIAARAMGVTTGELSKMLEQGLVPASEFLPKFAEQLNRELGDAASNAADRTAAAVNRLANAWEQAKQLSAEGFGNSATGGMNFATVAIEELIAVTRRARAEGVGFWAEMARGQWALLGLVGPINTTAESTAALGMRLKEAEAELQRLQLGAQKNPGNIFIPQFIREAQELVNKLKEAKAAKEALAEKSQSEQMGQASKAIDAIAAAGLERQAKATAALAEARNKVLGIDSTWAKKLQELEGYRRDGLITEQQYIEAKQAYTKTAAKAHAADKAQVDMMKEAVELYERGRTAALDAARSVAQRNVATEREISLGRELTAGEKELLELQAKLADGTLVMTAAQRDQHEIAVRYGEALRTLVQVRRDEAKWLQAAASHTPRSAELAKEVKAQEQANLEAQLGAQALARLEVAKVLDMAATAQRNAEIARSWDWEGNVTAEFERQAEALRRLAGLKEQGIHIQIAKDSASEWKRTTDSIENGLTDALMRAFESGEGFADAFTKTLVNAFKTMVLEPELRGLINLGGNALGSVLGLGGSGGAGGYLNTASNLNSLGYVAGGIYGLTGMSAGASAASLTYANAVGYMGGDSLGALIAANGSWGGVSAGAGATSAASGAAGGAAGGGASWAASLGPYAAIALVLLAMFGDFSKFSLGTVAEGSFGEGGKIAPDQFGDILWGNNPEKTRGGQLSGVVDQYGNAISSTAAFLGGSVGSDLGLSIGTDLDREGGIAGIIRLMREGQIISGTQTGSGAFGAGKSTPVWDSDALQIIGQSILPGEAAKKVSQEDIAKWFGEQLPVVIVQALQQSDLPTRFEEYFSTVQPALLTQQNAQEMLNTANAVQTLTNAFAPLGGVFLQFGTLSVDTFQKMATAAGGFDALGQAVAGYYSNFYSAEEQAEVKWASITRLLNEAGVTTIPQTREAFRTLVDGLDLSTESGRSTFGVLMQVQGAFADLVPAASSAADAVDTIVAAAERAAYPGRITNLSMLSTASTAADDAAAMNRITQAFEEAISTAGNPWAQYIDSRGGALPDVQMGGLFNSFALSQLRLQQQWDPNADNAARAFSFQHGGNSTGEGNAAAAEATRLQQQELEATRDLIRTLEQLGLSLNAWRDNLLYGDRSVLDPMAKYDRAAQEFWALNARAMAHDMAAAEQWQQAADQFLRQSDFYFGGGTGFAADQTMVLDALEALQLELEEIKTNTALGNVAMGEQTSVLQQANGLAAEGLSATKQQAQKLVS